MSSNLGQNIVVNRVFHCSAQRLWRALTEVEQMRQWYFEQLDDFKPEIGFETEFLIVNEGRRFPHHWQIDHVDPQKQIGYHWSFEGYEGQSHSLFKLNPVFDGVHLSIVCSGLESFSQDIPEFKPESCKAGWEFLFDRLKIYLQEN